ncbi:MAG: Ig-like domain-containing protein [Myxococcota bacterium]
MTRYLASLAAAMLIACGGDSSDTKDTGGTAGDDDDDACGNSISKQFPTDGDTDVFYKTDVRFTLAVEDATAVIAVTDGSGAEIPGTTDVVGTLVVWTGDDLTPSTAYTATLTYACGSAAVSWTTSDVGGPVAGDLTSKVFALDLASGDWVNPAGVGDLLASQLGETQIFVTPTAITADQITMLGGIGEAGVQDFCSPTIPFPPADWIDPYFELQSDLLPLVVAGLTINIEDLSLSGAFASDGSRIQGAALAGSIDTRPLAGIFDSTDPNAVCDLVATFQVACEACSDGSGDFCLSVYVDAIEAANLPGVVLEEITDAEIEQNPDCATTTSR